MTSGDAGPADATGEAQVQRLKVTPGPARSKKKKR